MFLVVLSLALCLDDPPCVRRLSDFLDFLSFAPSPTCVPPNCLWEHNFLSLFYICHKICTKGANLNLCNQLNPVPWYETENAESFWSAEPVLLFGSTSSWMQVLWVDQIFRALLSFLCQYLGRSIFQVL